MTASSDNVRWLARLGITFLLGVTPFASGCSGEARAADDTKPLRGAGDAAFVVKVAPLARGPVRRAVVATGVVGGVRELDLGFKVGGVLGAVRVEKGQVVRRGQVLAELDGTEVGAAVRQASEAAAKARRDKARVDQLFAHGAVAEAVRDDADTAERVADAARVSAEWTAARLQLVAPEDGIVEARLGEPGEVVAPGRPIVHLAAHPATPGGRPGGSSPARGWLVRAPVADAVAVALRDGDPVDVTLPSAPGVHLAARVARVAPAATRGTGTYEVEIEVAPDGGARLLSGLAAKVTFDLPVPRAVARAPLGALVDATGDAGALFVVRDGRAARVPVRLGPLLEGGHVALEGDVPDEPIVVEGAGLLVDGARVRTSGSAP